MFEFFHFNFSFFKINFFSLVPIPTSQLRRAFFAAGITGLTHVFCMLQLYSNYSAALVNKQVAACCQFPGAHVDG